MSLFDFTLVRAGEARRLSPSDPENFALKKSQDRPILQPECHWKLFNNRSRELHVPAWESASAADRKDRVSTPGPVTVTDAQAEKIDPVTTAEQGS